MSKPLRATVRRWWLSVALASALSLCACEEVVPTTQILIVVDAEDTLRPDIARLVLHTKWRESELSGDALAFPFSFSLVPGGEEDLDGDLSIVAYDASGDELVRRELELTFRGRRSLSYGVALTRECAELGPTCAEGETCVGCQGCDDITVPDEELVPLRYASQAIATWEERLYCPSAP
jgi:hypothetical protein